MNKAVLVAASVLALVAIALPTIAMGGEKDPDWRKLDSDLHVALSYAADRWGVSWTWLHNCAHSEGGHGRFVDNRPYIDTKVPRILGTRYDGDGWFQFLSGTWEWMANQAWKDGRGDRPPGEYRRVDSKLGQAYTAAWAFKSGHSGHWYGGGC